MYRCFGRCCHLHPQSRKHFISCDGNRQYFAQRCIQIALDQLAAESSATVIRHPISKRRFFRRLPYLRKYSQRQKLRHAHRNGVLFCNKRCRIEGIYGHDGPGRRPTIAFKDRIQKMQQNGLVIGCAEKEMDKRVAVRRNRCSENCLGGVHAHNINYMAGFSSKKHTTH